ncbi:TonB-dependent receptor [Idiomarina abyssalis]|uniref:TonB-dependent receptor n=1 Tax=Idiomarina abyssalis TaxID=86102 RepID=UPI002301D11C|nr:TonB-dependent receptor [Idiomarina abyssalis]MDA6067890.1 TonB-dependent receptor [Idiomarina abyssalis]
MKIIHSYLAASISTALFTSPVFADVAEDTQDTQDIEIIEVSGDFHRRTLNETTSSVSIIDKDAMQQRHSQHLQDTLNSFANVNFSGGTSTARFIQIRGIGERSQFVDPVTPSVGLLIDGIDYSGLGSAASLFDINQVEVFRGPQSGRFGVNAMAGLLLLDSTAPSSDFNGEFQLSAGNYSEAMGGLAMGGSLGVLGNARFSASQFRQDGYMENTYLDRDDTEQRDELSARLLLDTELSKDWLLQTVLHYNDVDNGYDAFSLDNTRETLSDEPGFDRLESQALRLQLSYLGFDNSRLEMSVNQLDADTGYAYDEDWTYEGIAPGWEYSSFDAYFRERDDKTAEVRWLSDDPEALLGIDSEWVLGLYYYDKSVQLTRDYFNWDLGVPAIFESDYDSKHGALYGELTQHWTDRVSTITGLRVERYNNDYLDSRGVTAEPEDTMVGGNFSLRYQASDESYLYATVARGYKAGGVNGEALGKAEDQGLEELENYLLERATFAPEILWSTELGVKGSSPDGRLTSRVSAFYHWRDDVQLKGWVNRDQSFVGYIENAAEGTGYGLEAEIRNQFTDWLAVFASASWLKTEIDGFVTEDGMDMTGREQAQAPNYQFNIGLEGWVGENFQWVIQADGKDEFYFSDSHNQKADSMAVLHLALNYHYQDWRISLWGRNLSDEDYEIRGFYFGNDPRKEYIPETYVQYGEPRRFGVTVSKSF